MRPERSRSGRITFQSCARELGPFPEVLLERIGEDLLDRVVRSRQA